MKRELIRTARRLLGAAQRRPSQSDLRRTLSTTYYAAFHALAELCADEIVGSSPARRSLPEWSRVYRALDHGRSRVALKELVSTNAPVDPQLGQFCEVLDKMRARRLTADYDPRPLQLRRADVALLIDEVEAAVEDLTRADGPQRRAFAFACVLAKRG